VDRFRSYVTAETSVLDGVEWICTINETNMLAIMVREAEAALDPPTPQGIAQTMLCSTPN
jgi:beta-glucosidase